MMRSKRYHHSQNFLLCVILTWPPLRIFSTILDHTLSSNEFLSPANNRTLVSPGKIFELGFFNLSSRWYLGMWYKNQLITRDYVWVANRDKPLSNPLGTLKLSDANLEIRDESTNILLWSTNLARRKTKTPLLAELLDNGNFVIRFQSRNVSDELFLWQSFDFPTDTLLPEMKLGWTKRRSSINRVLQSWASPHDPSNGEFKYFIDTTGGLPQRLLTKGGNVLTRVDSWNGIGSFGQPDKYLTENLKVEFTMTEEEITYSFRVITRNKIYSKLKMAYTGELQRLARPQSAEDWVLYWRAPSDMCESYAACGSYGQCDMNMSPRCRCIEGFKPRNEEAWTGMDFKYGCERKTPLSYNGRDSFHHLTSIKLPDTKTVTPGKGIDFKECERKCAGDPNCTAFAHVHMWNGAALACLIWTGELVDIRVFFAHGQDLHVKVANSTDQPHVKVANPDHGDIERSKSRMIIGLIVGLAGTIVLCFVIFYFWNRKQKRARANAVAIERTAVRPTRLSLSGENEDLALPRMELKTVVTATDNFSYALGQGGFGSVYKGKLLDGTLIAVKRLSKMSVQGTIEFENEVRLIAKLQHINLRLLGFCVDMDERILIYEYLENLSLDFYLFDKTEISKLNWRKRFDITKGIAQGIQYLHQESRFRIIHRDLKASNVLLDKDMIPKISDFGMARIIGNNEAEVNTRTVVGTIGYMSPEYRMHGVFSTKSDVFSFGVLMLEILSGKRNRGYTNLRGDTSLLTCAWRNWEEGNWLGTIDPHLIVDVLSSSPSALEEVRRCFQIALLCVQENASDRPMMSSVVMMLGSEAAIPRPKVSGYCVHCVTKTSLEIGSSSGTTDESWTANQVTISVIDPR